MTKIDLQPLLDQIDRTSVHLKRSYAQTWRRGMAGVVRRALAVTPPASRAASALNAGEGASRIGLQKADQERGQNAVVRDVFAIFVGIGTSGGRRAKVAGMLEAERIHDRLFATKTPGRAIRLDRPDKYVTTEDVLQGLIRKLQRKVGWLASAWRAGLQAFGVSAPAWVRNKNASGSAHLRESSGVFEARISHDDVPEKLQRELARRVAFGQRAQVAAMEREIRFLSQKQAQRFSAP